MMKLFERTKIKKIYLLKIGTLALTLWIVLSVLQHYVFGVGFLEAVIRSFLYTGATFVSAALLVGPLASITRHNLLFYRRTLGVIGFSLMVTHYATMVFLVRNGLLAPSLLASSLSFLAFIGEL